MPAIRIRAAVASIWKLIGSRMAMAPIGPRPGNTPTTVPKKTPATRAMRLLGDTRKAKPFRSPVNASIDGCLKWDESRRQGYSEKVEEIIGHHRCRQRDTHNRPARPAAEEKNQQGGQHR